MMDIDLPEIVAEVKAAFERYDYAVASTLFRRDTAPGKIGRQTQTWVRCPDGWRVVVGHVSAIDDPGGS